MALTLAFNRLPPVEPLKRVDPSHDNRIRERIRVWMRTTGYRQADIAIGIGRTQAWVSRYLRGKLNADFDTLNRIARVFGYELAHLIDPPWNEAKLVEAYRALRAADRKKVDSLISDLSSAARKRRA